MKHIKHPIARPRKTARAVNSGCEVISPSRPGPGLRRLFDGWLDENSVFTVTVFRENLLEPISEEIHL